MSRFLLGDLSQTVFQLSRGALIAFWVGTLGTTVIGLGFTSLLVLRGAVDVAAVFFALFALYLLFITRPSLRLARLVALDSEGVRIQPVLGQSTTADWKSIKSARVWTEIAWKSGTDQLEIADANGGLMRIQGTLADFDVLVGELRSRIPLEDARRNRKHA